MDDQMKMFEAGGIASQKDKASNAFSEMDEMLEKGISEEVKKQDGTTVSKTYKDPTYAAEDLLRMLRAGEITVEQAEQFLSGQKESGNYAKGGFEDGGLYQEGGTTDPVSGNEVPTGSLQEEVRDDIDAKLSEGEFVFPADVVRYIGLENLMQLRQKAKEGLGKMEDMGQMGNSEEAIMDDDLEYNADIDSLIDEFDPDEPDSMEFAVGGAVPGLNIPSFNPQSYMSSPGSLPSYSQFMGGSSVPQYSSKQYIGPNGDIITVTFLNGNPIQPIPEGYKVFTGQIVAPKVEIPKVQVGDTGGDGGDPEAEAERERQYEQYKANAATLAAYDPKFAEKWNQDPAKTGKFTGLADMVMKSVNTAMGMTDAVETVAQELGIDLGDYKNTGLSRIGGKYNVEAFTKNLNDMAEDLSAGDDTRANERAAQVREDFRAREEAEEAAFREGRAAKQKQATLDEDAQAQDASRVGESEGRVSYDVDEDAPVGRGSGGDGGFSDSFGDDEGNVGLGGAGDFGMAKGGLLAPRIPRKPKAKQTTSTRGKGLARKK